MNSNNAPTDMSLQPLLLGAGKILVLLQQLEHVVKLCCEYLQIKGIQISSEDLFSEQPKKRIHTLGRILTAMKEPMGFKQSFQTRLDVFIKSRNTFIHDYWTKNEVYSIDEPIDQIKLQKIAEFEGNLYSEIIYMTQVFLGLHYSTGVLLASREGKSEEFETDPEYERMRKYAPIFLSVIESEQS